MKTNLKRKNNLFFLGLAILALLFGAYWSVQNGLLNGSPSTVFAQVMDGDSGFLDDGTIIAGDSGPLSSGTIIPDGSGPLQTAPAPVRNDQCPEVNAPVNTCSNERGTGHSYCEWTSTGNIPGPCQIETCFNGQNPPDCGRPAQGNIPSDSQAPKFACETNLGMCGANQTYCEPTGSGVYHLVTKKAGVCDPANGAHESDGCAYIYDVDSTNYRDASCTTTTQAAPQPQPVSQTCFVCDNTGFSDGQGRWRVGGGCTSGSPVCQANNSATFGGCFGATAGAICETKAAPAPVVTQAPAPVVCAPGFQLINGTCQQISQTQQCPSNSIATLVGSTIICIQQSQQSTNQNNNQNNNQNIAYGGNAYVNINNSGQRVVRTQPRVVVASAPQTKVAASKVAVEELPKTGLPMVAWGLSGFLPLGLGLRRFGAGKKDLKDSASYLWQQRQFSR